MTLYRVRSGSMHSARFTTGNAARTDRTDRARRFGGAALTDCTAGCVRWLLWCGGCGAAVLCRDANGALLVYDITDRDSFTKVRHWVKVRRRRLSPKPLSSRLIARPFVTDRH
jgi:hypothetical protein